MRHLKTYEEKQSEDDKLAVELINRLPNIDIEGISYEFPTYIALLNNNKTKIEAKKIKEWDFGPMGTLPYGTYTIKVNSSELLCSRSYKKKIFSIIDRMYREEQNSIRLQNISTDIISG